MSNMKTRRHKRTGWQPLVRVSPQAFAKQTGKPTPEWMEEIWHNSAYMVFVANVFSPRLGPLTQLMIQRRSGQDTRNWAHMQRIKNEICGEERVGIEVFPAQSGVADTDTTHHIWVLTPPQKLGITLHGKPCDGIPKGEKEEEAEVKGR